MGGKNNRSWKPFSPIDMSESTREKAYKSVRRAFVDVSSGGGHTLSVEFSPSPLQHMEHLAFADIAKLRLFVPDDFASCEDTKACLAPLGADGSEEGIRLRNSNALQKLCLESKEPAKLSDSCARWQECLRASSSDQNHLRRLRTLLDAAGVVASTGAVALATVTISRKRGNARCMDPETEDPESWDCDCYENFQRKCAGISETQGDTAIYTEAECLRAIFCSDHRVCSEWKARSCKASSIEALQGLLNQNSSLLEEKAVVAEVVTHETNHEELVARRKSNDRSNIKTTDEVMSVKQCN